MPGQTRYGGPRLRLSNNTRICLRLQPTVLTSWLRGAFFGEMVMQGVTFEVQYAYASFMDESPVLHFYRSWSLLRLDGYGRTLFGRVLRVD